MNKYNELCVSKVIKILLRIFERYSNFIDLYKLNYSFFHNKTYILSLTSVLNKYLNESFF